MRVKREERCHSKVENPNPEMHLNLIAASGSNHISSCQFSYFASQGLYQLIYSTPIYEEPTVFQVLLQVLGYDSEEDQATMSTVTPVRVKEANSTAPPYAEQSVTLALAMPSHSLFQTCLHYCERRRCNMQGNWKMY